MAQEFKYTHDTVNGTISVVTPYNENFVKKARNLRGKWKDNAWHFDDSIEEYVRNEDGQPIPCCRSGTAKAL